MTWFWVLCYFPWFKVCPSVLYKFIFFNQKLFFSLGLVFPSFLQNTNDIGFGKLVTLYLHFIYLNLYYFRICKEFHWTRYQTRQVVFHFAYLINLINNLDKFTKTSSHFVTLSVALPPASFIGPVTQHSCISPRTQYSFVGPMTQHYCISSMTQHSFIGPKTQHSYIDHITQHSFIGPILGQYI